MKCNLAKTWTGWEPIDDRSKSYHKKGKLADIYYLDIKRYQDQRSAKFNAKYWVMLGEVVANQEKYLTTEHLHHGIKWALGYTRTEENKITGEVIKKVRSTNFEEMGETVFEQFYKDSITLIVRHIITGITEKQLMDRVDSILRFA